MTGKLRRLTRTKRLLENGMHLSDPGSMARILNESALVAHRFFDSHSILEI